jgi:TatD DNase family protein
LDNSFDKLLFDSHAHLLDKRFDPDRNEAIKGLGGIICFYSPGEDYSLFKQLLNKDFIWGSAGIHPHDASKADELWPELKEALQHNKVKALGEIGLDFYYDNSPRDIQKEVFKRQLELAVELKLPIVVHTRDAFEETLEILDNCAVKDILIHCFSGNVEQLEEALKRGYNIALGGVVTFPKAQSLKDVAAKVPLDKLLIETDCPYLAPVPMRGRRNQPTFVKYVAEEVAKLKGLNVEEVAKITYNNTVEFFNLKQQGRF